MTWIETVPEDAAEGPIAEAYDRVRKARGKLSNIMRVQSLRPDAMNAHMDLYLELLFGKGGLKRADRELIAVVVSMENDCAYCILHHAAALEAWWKDPDRVARLREDPASAGLSPREEAMVNFARKLTAAPGKASQEDVEAMRDVGLSDEEILQATMITGYFNFVNRIALGLGVDAPAEEVGGYRY